MSKTMTVQEAIKVFEMMKRLQPKIFERNSMCEEAVNKAIKVLEYRTPKKPLAIKNDEDVKIGAGTWKAGVPIYKCSHCNGFISRSSDFCPNCGQALDWSDDE